MLLGGLLPLDARTLDRWAPSGAWRLPVGDPYQVAHERPAAPGPFFVLRSVEWDGDRASHQGADLGCGSAGATVRAAASGVVVRAADHGEYGGYGTHVVLAHRLADGVLAYSVYAHLREGSLRVREGQAVPAGQTLARVGATGRVTTPHLHFEVRTADDPNQRWELTGVEDPLAFVEERLPTHRADTTGIGAWLEWAECAALVPGGARGEDALTHEAWWRMVAAASRGVHLDPALEPRALRDSLRATRLLPRGDEAVGTAGAPLAWRELARDLGRVRAKGVRLGSAPLRRARHREALTTWFGVPDPTAHMSALSGREGRPTLTDAVLLLGDLAGPLPEPPAKKPVVRTPAKRPARAKRPAVPALRDSLAPPAPRPDSTHTDSGS